MEQYDPKQRLVERLIATARVVVAISAALAILLDPSPSASAVHVTFAALIGYLVYALGLALLGWRLEAILYRLRLITHALDLVAFSFFIHLTDLQKVPPAHSSAILCSRSCVPPYVGSGRGRCGQRWQPWPCSPA